MFCWETYNFIVFVKNTKSNSAPQIKVDFLKILNMLAFLLFFWDYIFWL